MITDKEVEATKLSVTKKDFYQIWSELLETASKISERWDPTSTNESDPGIVLLKVLAACADKLNYNIDKNILEAYMPSAAQEESMRKLCQMMGYNIKYYQSAITDVKISYAGKKNELGEFLDNKENVIQSIVIPRFTSITNADNDINYITLSQETLGGLGNSVVTSVTVPCIEGELIQCETDTDNIISLNLLDDNHRYYLPESNIAENGIFVFNIDDSLSEDYAKTSTEAWAQVYTLNTQPLNTKCYSFGFDSTRLLPYIQFPDDISALIEDGLLVYYVRTTGINGNISANVLSSISKFWNDELDLNETDFIVTNPSASTNGANVETINQAYSNFKKTIGTFDTLVTCRDYMNKIYRLVNAKNVPLVSNSIVADIRDDINKAVNICTFSDYGICYKDQAIAYSDRDPITHFDITLYPFKTYAEGVTASQNKQAFLDSFRYTSENYYEILSDLDECKTSAHNIVLPESGDIACIKVYTQLKARIITTAKINDIEENEIKTNIFNNIYNTFNLRNVDFGEQISTDAILECIKLGDRRVKEVFLDSPDLFVRFELVGRDREEDDETKLIDVYLKSIAHNVISGRVPLFDYSTNFKPEYTEQKYPSGYDPDNHTKKEYQTVYPVQNPEKPSTTVTIDSIEPALNLNITEGDHDISSSNTDPKKGFDLLENQIVQFSAPSFKTTITYPGYVNYFIKLTDNSGDSAAVAAKMISIAEYILTHQYEFANFVNNPRYATTKGTFSTNLESVYTAKKQKYRVLFTRNASTNKYEISESFITPADGEQNIYYYVELNEQNFLYYKKWIQSISADTDMYRKLSLDTSRNIGYLVDEETYKYQPCTTWQAAQDPLTTYCINRAYEYPDDEYKCLGHDALYTGIIKNEEYTLGNDEYLLINYTKASDNDSGIDTVIQKYYGGGTVIRPNFEIIDSEKLHKTKSYAKTSGIQSIFEGTNANYQVPRGMFTLGTREQIEIREIAEVTFNEKGNGEVINLFWTMGTIDENGKKIFKTFKPGDVYELQENEYICYTDRDKNSMAYYGCGTLFKNNTAKKLMLDSTTTDLDIETIVEKGISAIKFTQFALKDTDRITITEQQIINITDDARLIELDAYKDKNYTQQVTCLSSEPSYVKNQSGYAAKYSINGEYKYVPKITYGDGWKVKSLLTLNVGPSAKQTLRYGESLKLNMSDHSTEVIKPLKPSEGASNTTDLSVKTNMLIQASSPYIDLKTYEYSAGTSTYNKKDNNFKIELFENKPCPTNMNADGDYQDELLLNNFGEYWTKIPAKNLREGNCAKFNLNIPNDNTFGMVMIYLSSDKPAEIKNGDSPTTMYLEFEGGNPTIFNNIVNNMEAWWPSRLLGNKYYLKPGINNIRIPKNTTSMKLYKSGDDEYDVAIISELDIVNTSTINPNGINYRLLGIDSLDQNNIANNCDKLLKIIKNLDTNNLFYYNCLMSTGTAIDVKYVASSKNPDTLLSPRVWFDSNNIYNKFVINEIDVEHLDEIVISNACKK